MNGGSLISRLYARWQIARAIGRLDPANLTSGPAETLRAVSPQCWPQLRRAAFRRRTSIGVAAAALLNELGDVRGLYALLEQYYDRDMYAWYGPTLRRALSQIGSERVLNVLESCLDQIETPPLVVRSWALYVAVYALHALGLLHASIPAAVWRRALTLFVPGFEELYNCRDVIATSWPEAPLLATVSAVRRAAVDALLILDRGNAFEFLRDALGHPDPQVQLTALYGLRQLKDTRAYVLLQPIASDPRHPLTRDARRAIEAFGTRQPDALTLVRASNASPGNPAELLRPATTQNDSPPELLLRPVAASPNSTETEEPPNLP